MARLIVKTQQQRTRVIGQFSDGSDHQEITSTAWVVDGQADGQPIHAEFDHEPTPDEVLALLPVRTRLRPSTLADRLSDAAELARDWNTLRDAATAAAADPEFLATERTRLNNLRDLAKAALRGYV